MSAQDYRRRTLPDTVAMSEAYNGICGAITSLKKVTEDARPYAIITHLEVVRESLAGVLAQNVTANPMVSVPLADLLVILKYMETATPKHRQELLNALDRLGDITLKTRMGWAK